MSDNDVVEEPVKQAGTKRRVKPHAGLFKKGNQMGRLSKRKAKAAIPLPTYVGKMNDAKILLMDKSVEIMEVAIKLAIEGDAKMIQLLVPRIMPVEKLPRMQFDMADVSTPEGLEHEISRIATGVASGAISGEAASNLISIIKVRMEAHDQNETLHRLDALEEKFAPAIPGFRQ